MIFFKLAFTAAFQSYPKPPFKTNGILCKLPWVLLSQPGKLKYNKLRN